MSSKISRLLLLQASALPRGLATTVHKRKPSSVAPPQTHWSVGSSSSSSSSSSTSAFACSFSSLSGSSGKKRYNPKLSVQDCFPSVEEKLWRGRCMKKDFGTNSRSRMDTDKYLDVISYLDSMQYQPPPSSPSDVAKFQNRWINDAKILSFVGSTSHLIDLDSRFQKLYKAGYPFPSEIFYEFAKQFTLNGAMDRIESSLRLALEIETSCGGKTETTNAFLSFYLKKCDGITQASLQDIENAASYQGSEKEGQSEFERHLDLVNGASKLLLMARDEFDVEIIPQNYLELIQGWGLLGDQVRAEDWLFQFIEQCKPSIKSDQYMEGCCWAMMAAVVRRDYDRAMFWYLRGCDCRRLSTFRQKIESAFRINGDQGRFQEWIKDSNFRAKEELIHPIAKKEGEEQEARDDGNSTNLIARKEGNEKMTVASDTDIVTATKTKIDTKQQTAVSRRTSADNEWADLVEMEDEDETPSTLAQKSKFRSMNQVENFIKPIWEEAALFSSSQAKPEMKLKTRKKWQQKYMSE